MDTPGPIKRVPKWAWIASGGVAAGVVVMRMRSNTGSQKDTAVSGDATAPGDFGQTGYFPSSGVVTSGAAGDSGSSGDGSAQIDVPGLIDSVGNVVSGAYADAHKNDPNWEQLFEHYLDVLPAFAGGGGAPASSATNSVPADNPPGAAPAPPAPPVPGSSPAPVVVDLPAGAATGHKQCGGSFPYYDETHKTCYRVQCNPPGRAKGRWHFHDNGDAVKVSTSC